MAKNKLTFILVFLLIISGMPIIAKAAYNPPASFDAPKNVAVEYREDGFEKTWVGFNVNISASDDLRAFVDLIGTDNSAFSKAGFNGFAIMVQTDYKVDNGNWHYKSAWEEDRDYNTNKSLCGIEKGNYTSSVVFDKSQFESISGNEALPVNKTYFDNHTMHFRARFVINYQDETGNYLGFFSPWSQTVSYSNKQKIEDPSRLINHATVLKSAELKKSSDGTPYLSIRTDKAHEEIQLLNNISNGWVKADVWLRVNNGEWKACHSDNFVEEFNIGAEAYFGLKDSYAAAVYEIKFRYVFDYLNYPAAGKSGTIYSPYSNVISHGMSAYSAASSWAKTELDKADRIGLIPPSLKGADMTRPITREEFAELAVKLYEKTTGKAATASSPNPFKDTKNPEILKAFKLGITTGTSATTFAPKELTNREQVAAMLSRAIRVMAPNGDFSTTGAPTFTDKKEISSWALNHVLFMARLEVIKGTDGKFMPKATTTAQTASGYATTTREQAIAMSVRSFEQMDMIKSSKGASAPASVTPAAPTGSKTATPAPGTPDASSGNSGLIGTWGYSDSNGNVDMEFMLEFKTDGTFHKVVSTGSYGGRNATEFSGKYRTEGNNLTLYNQLKSTGPASSRFDKIWYLTMDSYETKDISVEDAKYEFSKSDDKLRIGDTAYTRGR